MPFLCDTSGVEAMVRDLASFAGHGSHTEQALVVTTGKILDAAIGYTPMATEDELVERVNWQVTRDFTRYDDAGGSDAVLTTNQGKRGMNPAGTQWWREGGKFYIMKGPGRFPAKPNKDGSFSDGASSRFVPGGPRWSNERWANYQATAAQRQADFDQSLRIRQRKAKEALGLTRQSWVQIADALNIPLHSPKLGTIRAAIAGDGVRHENGTAYRDDSEEGIAIVIENTMPILVRGDGAAILQRAISTRLSAFEMDMRKGVFEDLDTFARRYRGLEIRLN